MNKYISILKSRLVALLQLERMYLYFINMKYGLHLDFNQNKGGIHILREVFSKKVYSHLFPFGQKITVVDVGAHFGFFSMYASLHAGKESRIFALEPSTSNYQKLKENLQNDSFPNIIPHKIALAGQTSSRQLSIGRPQNHSLIASYIPGLNAGEIVNCLSLDDFIKNNDIGCIDFMKMDCEGSEYEILLNASKTSFDKIKVISTELHDMRHCGYQVEDLIQFMTEMGFSTNSEISDKVKNLQYFNVGLEFVKS